ncbi:ROK family protein [Paucilactobacillus kaifaensis]|uniref:ROK family protein n=1 Tax=Paucilactobacillus kaifaensis TaxID=2559921 RepID=UPI0010F9A17F|nr:ROK family protein [Paucilactobacillus kaifaensis]
MKNEKVNGSVLAFDIGGTSVKYGLWHEQKLSNKGKFVTPTRWVEMVEQLKHVQTEFAQLLTSPIIGIAISLPGSVNTDTGLIAGTSAVHYLNGFDIRQELSEQLGLPVSVQNDANCAALAESWLGNASETSLAALLVVGSGIGGAIVANKKLLTGHEYFTGEFGYAVMNAAGDTLSELGSPVKMAQRFNQLNSTATKLSGKGVFDAADKGNALAQKCVDEFYHWLGIAAYNIMVSVNPDCLLIGGAISARRGLVSRLTQQVNVLMEKHEANMSVNIQTCYFENDANLIGAVYQFLNEPGRH